MDIKSKLLNEILNRSDVEWKPLAKIAEIGTGSRNTNEAVNGGKYTFFVRSQTPLRINEYEFDETAIITAGDGVGVGKVFHFFTGKYALHQRAYRVHVMDTTVIDPKYLFYYMKSDFYDYLVGVSVHASVTSLRKPMFEKYLVPIPPLSIQQKIVDILDSFTTLTAELTAELTARKQQYEYYRDELLTFGDDVEWKSLKEIANIKNGKDWKNLGVGDVPVYGSGGIMQYVDTFVYNKPTVLIPRKGTITNIFYLEEPFWNVDTIYYTEININKIIPKFFYYFMTTIDLMRLDTGSGRPSLTQAILNRIKIPIPPLDEQSRIVEILDKFDALTNSITEGLPREIELREQQYEYYRDLLLSYPKPKKE